MRARAAADAATRARWARVWHRPPLLSGAHARFGSAVSVRDSAVIDMAGSIIAEVGLCPRPSVLLRITARAIGCC